MFQQLSENVNGLSTYKKLMYYIYLLLFDPVRMYPDHVHVYMQSNSKLEVHLCI